MLLKTALVSNDPSPPIRASTVESAEAFSRPTSRAATAPPAFQGGPTVVPGWPELDQAGRHGTSKQPGPRSGGRMPAHAGLVPLSGRAGSPGRDQLRQVGVRAGASRDSEFGGGP